MTQALSESRIQHWAHINEFSFIAGIRLMFWTYRVFGRWPFRALLYPVLLWYMIAKPTARAASMDYLRRVAEQDNRGRVRPGTIGVLRHFASFGESILDKLLLWSGSFDAERVEFHGAEQIDALIAAKRGALLIGSHLGNLDLCRVMAKHRSGLRLTVLTHTKHARLFNRLLAQIDPESRLNIMQVTEISPATAILLANRVARGEFIAMVGDRIPVAGNRRVVSARFLGAMAGFPIGPYVLAAALRCPVYLLFSLRTGSTSLIHFERFREAVHLPRKIRSVELARLVSDYAARLEHFCLRAPLQWFNFYDFWHLPRMDAADDSR